MSRTIKVHDSVADKADELSDKHGITLKEAIRQMCREGEAYDV